MSGQEKNARFEIGMVGLGVMGRNLLLNMADHGFAVAGYDRDPEKVLSLKKEGQSHGVGGFETVEEFVGSLKRPRSVMMLVPAGAAVDEVIEGLLPFLEKGDLIIDAGNSHFTDTNVRAENLAAKGLLFLGVGVSGGEEGARHGPSIMPGGHRDAYERVRPILEAASAKVKGDPCVTYMGPGSAGHYVKMVHNGIEYALMQLISETYDIMKRGLGLNDRELHEVYRGWNQGELGGYLMEITSDIFNQKDDRSGKPLIDVILGVARQKGTGMWTSESAMDLQVPTPTIDLAVAMRDLSVFEGERKRAHSVYSRPIKTFEGDRTLLKEKLSRGLLAATLIVYAQGMALLAVASKTYDYELRLEDVSRIWRGGCIIRSALLEDIMAAFQSDKDLPNLLLDPNLAKKIMGHQEDLRFVVETASRLGIPVPGLMVSLGYFDAYRSEWSTANLIQAQRDYFGSHTYERIDEKGKFHTQWSKS
ncbi:MAG: NADP-dependent phosphogluconate dehydrogenase [Leptospirales bacterium]